MKKLQSIGTIELVSLPDFGVHDVPAKIDTGADSSAIWASDIKEQDGNLGFVLFNKTSPIYSGQVINISDYKIISVKNSFGQSEFRYQIKLKLNLAGRNIQATFTLANRASNKYPILIGKRTLQKKFVVDVARKSPKKKLEVLMLSTKRTAVTNKFTKNLERYSKKLHITYATYDDLRFITGEPGNQITLIKNNRNIASFDMVYFKTYNQYQVPAASVAVYLQKRAVPFIDQDIHNFPAISKIHQYIALSDYDISVPHSIFMTLNQLEKSYIYLKQHLGLPFVLKDIEGNKGEFNFLIKDRPAFQKACRAAAKQLIQFVAQAFIDNDEDYRILVLGTKIALVIKRARRDPKTHLNNTSRGAKATLVKASTLPAVVQTASLAAAKLLDRQIAGVDFVQDKNSGLWYCLEVNYGPQLATGTFTEEKQAVLAAYLERKLSK